jgi:glyoxylase-like metal-dependent hydrolase (beta-lactamase superfamily II)
MPCASRIEGEKMSYRLSHAAIFAASLMLAAPAPATAQTDWDDVEVKTVKVADGVYMLEGRGGNIGLCTGEDGAFLVDDQYAPLTDKIKAAIAEVSGNEVKFLLNTHWHGDHTGGNENFGEAGAIIFAHENVRKLMSKGQFMKFFNQDVPAASEGALPVVTFTDALTFRWNGEEIHVFHVKNAHTDGDAIVHFKRANVIHMGDTFFNGNYPYIEAGTGGSIHGVIAAAERVLALVTPETKIIPGHGSLSGPAELREYRDMLVAVRDRITMMMNEGKSLVDIVAADPTSDFDARWGTGWIKADRWVPLVYEGMTGNAP